MLIMPRWILQDLSFEIAPNWEQHVRTLHRAPLQNQPHLLFEAHK